MNTLPAQRDSDIVQKSTKHSPPLPHVSIIYYDVQVYKASLSQRHIDLQAFIIRRNSSTSMNTAVYIRVFGVWKPNLALIVPIFFRIRRDF